MLKDESIADPGKPLVSVIVPIYNVREYLAACLDSLCSQSLREIEIICVDDASTDGSAEILRDFDKLDNRIRAIFQDSNRGVSVARNEGLARANGKYIKIIDSDDVLQLDSLEVLVNEVEAHDADIVFHDANLLDEHGKRELYPYCERHRKLHDMLGHAAWWYMFKGELLSKHPEVRFPEGAHPHEDSTFSFMLITFCKTHRYVVKALLDYRQHDGMVMRQVSGAKREQHQRSSELCLVALSDFYQELPRDLANRRRIPYEDLAMLFWLYSRPRMLPFRVRTRLQCLVVGRFLFRRKFTRSGRMIVKVCGIPVWLGRKRAV